jgi:hypothetical protein
VSVAADLTRLLEPMSSELGRACLDGLGIDRDERLLGVNLTNERFVTDPDLELSTILVSASLTRIGVSLDDYPFALR